jgi:hypothetical protein
MARRKTPYNKRLTRPKGFSKTNTNNTVQAILAHEHTEATTTRHTAVVLREVITTTTQTGGGHRYLIKWKGFPDSQNTWEPREHLEQYVPSMIAEFHGEVALRQLAEAAVEQLKGMVVGT